MTLESIIGYTFTHKRLLQEALTHPSCAESFRDVPFNYQRLEFLGDSVLGLVVAELLYGLFPGESEGSLAKRHSALVRSESLATVARNLKLGEHMHVGGEQDSTRENNSSLEDVCEAIIGALYLDGGFEVARKFILTHWEPLARLVRLPPKDAKTTLQEWAQERGLPLPRYHLAETIGPAHAPEFTIEASIEGHKEIAVAKAPSKRQAEQMAAKALLEKLENK